MATIKNKDILSKLKDSLKKLETITVDDKNISYDRHAENGVFMGVVGVVEGANQTVTAFAAMVGAMEPAMDLVETTSLVADWVTNPDEPMRLNGLAYTCTPMDDGLYLLGFAVVGE